MINKAEEAILFVFVQAVGVEVLSLCEVVDALVGGIEKVREVFA